MTKKKDNSGGWIGIIIFGFIIISNFPILIPFLIFGGIMYFVIKNGKKVNYGVDGEKMNYDSKGKFDNFMDSDIVKAYKEKNPELYNKVMNTYKSKIGQSKIKPQSRMSNLRIDGSSSNKLQQTVYSYKTNTTTSKSNSSVPKSKIKPIKAYKSAYSSRMKKQKTYKYNSGKSIWDDYESVVDTMFKNK